MIIKLFMRIIKLSTATAILSSAGGGCTQYAGGGVTGGVGDAESDDNTIISSSSSGISSSSSLTLLSCSHPNNTKLNQVIELEGGWEVVLVEVSFSPHVENVLECHCYYTMTFTSEDNSKSDEQIAPYYLSGIRQSP